ncbi:hypothetical protein QE152_g1022 [Popillia japonica]|uniref:Uncharacterized protein n=1 Tax=Popillia japonica TaxID=7064 RepID=A0AAW1N6M5_POPJA
MCGKILIALVLYTSFVLVFASPQGNVLPTQYRSPQPCKCVQYNTCDGTVNPYVACHPSYAIVCCNFGNVTKEV